MIQRELRPLEPGHYQMAGMITTIAPPSYFKLRGKETPSRQHDLNSSRIINPVFLTEEQQKGGLDSDHTWASQENDVFLVDRPEVALDNRMPDSFTNLEVGDFKELQLQSLDPERKFSIWCLVLRIHVFFMKQNYGTENFQTDESMRENSGTSNIQKFQFVTEFEKKI